MIIKRITSLLCGFAFVGVTVASALPAGADQAPDKTGPGVARVSVVQGSAVVQRGDSNTQSAAVLNAPLLPGDYISTGATSRAELQFDGYTAVRLGGSVQARVTNNDPDNRGLQLAEGTIEFGIVHDARSMQIDTPSVSVRSQTAGDYRIAVQSDGSSWITVRRGSAEVITPQRSYTLEEGKTLIARGAASDPSISYTDAIGFDTFDDFNAKRDQTMVAALNASPNVNPGIAGYDNLDQYGQWENVAGSGQAWVPEQSSNWAPYQNGSWTWEDGYGWTWVSSDPWGWAPYHYGRWSYANGYGWAWYPPAYTAYSAPPAWSPALVGFFGFGLSVGGPGWGVGVGFGGPGYGVAGGWGYPGIGWYPLAPYAAYYPWYPGWAWSGYGWGWPGYRCCGYRYGYGYGWGPHYASVTHINNYYYGNNFYHHGATGTLTGNFTHGNFSHNVSVDPHNISKFGTIHGALPVTPGRENLGYGGGTVHAPVTMSKTFDSARFASNRALAARTSFADQQRAVAQTIHANDARDNAAVTHEGTGRQGAPTTSWQHFNDSRGSAYQSRGSAYQSRGSAYQSRGNAYQSRGNAYQPREGSVSGAQRAPSDSWSRYSQSRGVVTSYGDREAQSHGVITTYGDRDSYSHSSYPSYSHSSSPSYSRSSYPSYSHSSYPSYSHGSYPSYSRGSSYQTYSRGSSYPSYSRGSGGSAPHASGGGYGGEHGGGHGGGRPPTN